jgi:hypothetical protein
MTEPLVQQLKSRNSNAHRKCVGKALYRIWHTFHVDRVIMEENLLWHTPWSGSFIYQICVRHLKCGKHILHTAENTTASMPLWFIRAMSGCTQRTAFWYHAVWFFCEKLFFKNTDVEFAEGGFMYKSRNHVISSEK